MNSSMRGIATSDIPIVGARSHLSRYYTKEATSALLYDGVGIDIPKTILDLGAGQGALSLPAVDRWRQARLTTVDIDPASGARIRARLKGKSVDAHEHHHFDVLGQNFSKRLGHLIGTVDLGLSNPPFSPPNWKPHMAEFLSACGLHKSISIAPRASSALLFLARILSVLKSGGIATVILPDSLISGKRHTAFREQLLETYEVLRVLKLPRGAFVGTDAQAHVLAIRHGGATRLPVKVQQYNMYGGLTVSRMVEPSELSERMDATFLDRVGRSLSAGKTVRLGDIAESVTRGSISSAQIASTNERVLHLGDLNDSSRGAWRCLHSGAKDTAENDKRVRAHPGDILVARIGRDLARRVCGVRSGSPLISDCLFAIRVPKEWRGCVLARLASDEGRSWLEANTAGVSAQYIAKGALLNFPIAETDA